MKTATTSVVCRQALVFGVPNGRWRESGGSWRRPGNRRGVPSYELQKSAIHGIAGGIRLGMPFDAVELSLGTFDGLDDLVRRAGGSEEPGSQAGNGLTMRGVGFELLRKVSEQLRLRAAGEPMGGVSVLSAVLARVWDFVSDAA